MTKEIHQKTRRGRAGPPSDVKRKVATAFSVALLPNGELRLMLSPDGTATHLQITTQESTVAVAKLLVAAATAFKKSGKALPDFAKTKNLWAVVYPEGIGLAPARKPDHACLMVRFGDARIGFEIPTVRLRAIGQAMLALSASSSKPN